GELYRLPDEVWRRVEAGEPPNLYKGPVELEDGRVVDGILYPRALAEGHHRDISGFGDWRAYVASGPTPEHRTRPSPPSGPHRPEGALGPARAADHESPLGGVRANRSSYQRCSWPTCCQPAASSRSTSWRCAAAWSGRCLCAPE